MEVVLAGLVVAVQVAFSVYILVRVKRPPRHPDAALARAFRTGAIIVGLIPAAGFIVLQLVFMAVYNTQMNGLKARHPEFAE